MKHWPTRSLAEVCLINPKLTALDTPTADTIVSFVPMASVDEVKGAIKQPQHRQYGEVAKGYTPFRENDVLFAKITPCMENGKAAIARDLRGGLGFGSTEFHVLRPTSNLLPEWVFAFVRQPSFRSAAKAHFTGSAGQKRVPVDFLRKVLIPVPPVAEQRRLVKLLDEADALRKLRAEADSRTDSLIAALFQEMFGDPATNSKGWPLRPAGELMDACDYGTSQKANELGRGIVVLRMGNVTTTGELKLDDLKTVELADGELARQRLRAGDILFNRTNSRELVGKTGMWDGRFEAVAASYFIRARFRPDVEHPQHFTTFMNLPYMKRRLAEMARGAIGQANINAKELKSIPVPVPPVALQAEFAKQVTEIRELEGQQGVCRRSLECLFNSMLHRAFNGEL
jgi:type I restriction enzyme, S subunit